MLFATRADVEALCRFIFRQAQPLRPPPDALFITLRYADAAIADADFISMLLIFAAAAADDAPCCRDYRYAAAVYCHYAADAAADDA